jgi:hypothetical protein
MNLIRRNLILCFAVAVVLGILGYRGLTKPATAEPGSALAARFLAAEYVGKALSADPVRVDQAPSIQADRATVIAVVGVGKECTVRMIRSNVERKYGWLVESLSCDQIG